MYGFSGGSPTYRIHVAFMQKIPYVGFYLGASPTYVCFFLIATLNLYVGLPVWRGTDRRGCICRASRGRALHIEFM
jgi:hypothetical protein